MKKWYVLLAVLLLLPLSACGGEDDSYFWGRVAEVQRGPDGLPSALILDTGDGEREGVFWDESTQVAVSQAVEEVLAGESFQSQVPVGTEVSVYLRPDVEGKPLTAQDGTEFPDAGTAEVVTVEEILSPESLTLSDGTQAEIWVRIGGDRTYRLSGGTELLRERPQETNFSTYYVEGDTPLTALPAALLDGVTACYQERGALYDLQTEVERAYGAYTQDPEKFQSYLAEQWVSWSATSPGVYYFLTTLNLSVEPGIMTRVQFTDAFDRETGEHIPNEDLFSAGRTEVLDALISQMDVDQDLERELREHFQWSYLVFWPDHLDIRYPAGSLPSQEHSWGWGIDYEDLAGVLHPWATPEVPED